MHGVGKIADIFADTGIDQSTPTSSNGQGMAVTTRLLREVPDGTFIFTNLVETDMLWGHRNDPRGFADALEDIDAALPDLMAAMHHGDLLILTSDHGCDPTTPVDRPLARARPAAGARPRRADAGPPPRR